MCSNSSSFQKTSAESAENVSARSSARENGSSAVNANEKTGNVVREGECETVGSRTSASLSAKSFTTLVDDQDAVVGRLPTRRAFEDAYTAFFDHEFTSYEPWHSHEVDDCIPSASREHFLHSFYFVLISVWRAFKLRFFYFMIPQSMFLSFWWIWLGDLDLDLGVWGGWHCWARL